MANINSFLASNATKYHSNLHSYGYIYVIYIIQPCAGGKTNVEVKKSRTKIRIPPSIQQIGLTKGCGFMPPSAVTAFYWSRHTGALASIIF